MKNWKEWILTILGFLTACLGVLSDILESHPNFKTIGNYIPVFLWTIVLIGGFILFLLWKEKEALVKESVALKDKNLRLQERVCQFGRNDQAGEEQCLLKALPMTTDGNDINIKLSLRSQIEEFNTLIKAKEIAPSTGASYIEKAQAARTNSIREIHVLFATQEAINEFYAKSQNDWINSETNPRNIDRRRIVVLDKKIYSEDRKFRHCLANIYKTCTGSSTVKLIAKDEAKAKFPRILRDFGIFWANSESKRGFFAYVPFPRTDVFGQYPGKYYVVDEQDFLNAMVGDFSKVWDHITSNPDAERELINRLLDELKDPNVAAG